MKHCASNATFELDLNALFRGLLCTAVLISKHCIQISRFRFSHAHKYLSSCSSVCFVANCKHNQCSWYRGKYSTFSAFVKLFNAEVITTSGNSTHVHLEICTGLDLCPCHCAIEMLYLSARSVSDVARCNQSKKLKIVFTQKSVYLPFFWTSAMKRPRQSNVLFTVFAGLMKNIILKASYSIFEDQMRAPSGSTCLIAEFFSLCALETLQNLQKFSILLSLLADESS